MSIYVPAVEMKLTFFLIKNSSKVRFFDEMLIFLKKKINKKIVICGDLNIAPNEDDVWSHKI